MLCRDKLPESTGDKLTAGEMIPTFLGELDWTLLGKFELYRGNDSIECLIYLRGTIFRSRLPGIFVKNIRISCWGMLRSAGDNPTSLRLIVD